MIVQLIQDLENIQFNNHPRVYPGHTFQIESVAISDDQKYIASGADNYEVLLWDLKNMENIKKYKGPMRVFHLSFSRDNKRLAVSAQLQFNLDKKGKTYNILIFDITDLKRNDPIQVLKAHQGGIYRTVFTKNSKNLISGSQDKQLIVLDVDGQKPITGQYLNESVNGVAISVNEELIGCCCDGGLAYLFDSTTLQQLKQVLPPWKAHKPDTYCIEFIQDSLILLTSGKAEIRLWSVQDLLQKKVQCMKELQSGENNAIWTVKAYPVSNPKVLVACDGKIKIWKLENSELKQTIEVQGGLDIQQGYQFALTSDFKKIVTGGSDKNLKLYEQDWE